jgi:hypothetical protein
MLPAVRERQWVSVRGNRRTLRHAMGLFDPNRWPKPYPMLTSTKRVVVGSLILLAVVLGLLIVLSALAD